MTASTPGGPCLRSGDADMPIQGMWARPDSTTLGHCPGTESHPFVGRSGKIPLPRIQAHARLGSPVFRAQGRQGRRRMASETTSEAVTVDPWRVCKGTLKMLSYTGSSASLIGGRGIVQDCMHVGAVTSDGQYRRLWTPGPVRYSLPEGGLLAKLVKDSALSLLLSEASSL